MSKVNCTKPDQTPDWNAYALKEMDAASIRDAEDHAAGCTACREELATLRLTLNAMSSLREEEVPRRIAFVSDKVFEPKWFQRGIWQTLLNPTFAAASVLAAAIVLHGFTQSGSGADESQVQARIDQAVSAAVADVEARQEYILEAVRRNDQRFTAYYMQNTGLVR